MSDLICKNTGARCQTPGTCSPFGGCREVEPVSSVWLEQLRSEFRQAVRDKDRLTAEIEALRKALERIKFRLDSFIDGEMSMSEDSMSVTREIVLRALAPTEVLLANNSGDAAGKSEELNP